MKYYGFYVYRKLQKKNDYLIQGYSLAKSMEPSFCEKPCCYYYNKFLIWLNCKIILFITFTFLYIIQYNLCFGSNTNDVKKYASQRTDFYKHSLWTTICPYQLSCLKLRISSEL